MSDLEDLDNRFIYDEYESDLMNKQTPIDVEATPTTAVAVRPQQTAVAPSGLFGNVTAVEVIGKATEVATALKTVIERQGLISRISGREYPRCEAWTLLGTMLGIYPVLDWCRKIDNGWEARVEARTRDGAIIGAAEAECLRSEKNWGNRDDYALRSMAQTRATAKALRMPLGFVMTLAGYEATPAEEMPREEPERPRKALPAAAPKPATGLSTNPKDTESFLERCKAKLVREVSNISGYAAQYGYDRGMILDNEQLADATVTKLFPVDMSKSPADLAEQVKEIAQEHLQAIRDMAGVAEQDPPEHDDSPPADPPDDGLTHFIRGKLEAVSCKTGQSKKGTWTRYGCKVGETWANTFDTKLGKKAESLKGINVVMAYTEGEKGNDLVDINPE